MKPLISIVTPCYNEEENISELYARITKAIESLSKYQFEILFIDNSSTDRTVEIIKGFCASDPRIKLIVNNRNFGHIRSPYWGIIQSSGDATIYLASDLQDPPEYIAQFIAEWEMGWKIVLASKPVSQTNFLFHSLRKLYYRLLDRISDVDLVKDTTGFGIYDRQVLDYVREINDPYPYLRGMICELGFPIKTIEFNQPRRVRGVSKNNFYTLYDIAMLGIVSHSLVPLRIASMLGLFIGGISFLVGLLYFVLKLIYWNSFPMGMAPLIIGIFFMFGILFVFIGLLGEYIGSIHTYVKNRPIVVEKERINF
jgi:dolichol-phosphate mannosyltransferase